MPEHQFNLCSRFTTRANAIKMLQKVNKNKKEYPTSAVRKNKFYAVCFHFLQVHIKSSMILNGVCVCWQGWIDTNRLEGMGCLEFDEVLAYQENIMLTKQIKHYNKRHDVGN